MVIIAIVATGLSIASFQYSTAASAQIAAAATEDLKENGRVQAFDVSKSLETKLVSVRNNLQILASAPLIKAGDYAQARTLVNTAQNTTEGFTDSYFWVDGGGKLQWANSFVDEKIYSQYYGIDRSDRPYFTGPKQDLKPYFSALIESIDDVPRIFIAYPVLGGEDGSPVFRGIVAASINLETLGNHINAQLPTGSQSQVSLMDKDGTILFTQNDALVGKNYFSEQVQNLLFTSYIPAGMKDSFNALMQDSVAGNSGVGEFSSSGVPLIIAYHPVAMADSESHVMSLHVVLPKTFATNIALVIELQRNFSTIVPVIIGVVAVGIAFVVIGWNKRLENIVKERTIELKTANEQLKSNDKMQKEFINIAAHELRTPIQPILGMAEMLEDQLLSGGKDEITVGKPEVDMITRNAKRLLNLSYDLLEVSRIESNTMSLNLGQIDLKQKIQNVLSDMRGVIPEGKHLRLSFEPKTDNAILVSGDRERLFEVLSNLLTNAIKFTDEGEIIVSLEEKAGQAVVSVRDTGRGIAPEIYPRLFTKFTTMSEHGTGLGLFIVKNIVEAHGGKIWAANNADGKGATFTFTLPVSLDQREKLPRDL